MFMVSFRLSRRNMLIGLLALILVIALGVVSKRTFRTGSVPTTAPVAEMAEGAKVKKSAAKTNPERIAFAESFGWEVSEEPIEIMEVVIPQEFDESYERYNNIQKKQGLDLAPFAGKRIKRYVYEVTNYPGVNAQVRISMLVYKNKVIGGDVCSLEENSFMHGFQKPQ